MRSLNRLSPAMFLRFALALAVVCGLSFAAWRVSAAAERNGAARGGQIASHGAAPNPFTPNPTGNSPGTVDLSFNPNAFDVYAIAVQADGKILIGGSFTSLNPNGTGSVTRNHIARLNADGTLDSAFDPNVSAQVNSIAVQADGKILIGGFFTSLNPNGTGSVARTGIARLNADGTLDSAFDPRSSGTVLGIAVQADGKILIGGAFTSVNPNGTGSVTRNRIARLNADGTLDPTFDPNARSTVNAIAVQADGKILIGGAFTSLNPNGAGFVVRNRIVRLNADGTLDSAFDPNVNNSVLAIAVQVDGKIIIGGQFTSVNPNGTGSVTRNRIARLNADGTLDSAFDPNANSDVWAIAVQADGKILIGGQFLSLNPNGTGSVARTGIARLYNDAATQSLTVPSTSTVQWLRGGASPEALRVTFELSTDGGSTWTPLGAGARISGGWNLIGLSLPTSGQIRARAFIPNAGGGGNTGGASASIVEAVTPYTFILCPTVTLATASPLPAGTVGTGYSNNFSASGGVGPYTFTVKTGTIPTGLTLNANGTWSGTATAAGTFNFTVEAKDSSQCPGSQAYQVTILCPSITLAPTTLFTGRVGASYSQTFTPSGGSAPFTFNVTGLPPGLSTSATSTSVTVGGQPLQAGSFTITVTATDGYGCQGSRSYTLYIGVPGDLRLSSDYNGDGKADLAIFRPATATFYVSITGTGSTITKQLGVSTDLPVPGDYDGDGKTDFALWRPSTGAWLIVFSSTGTSPNWTWGIPGDVPVPGDYDGDGKTDLAVWRPSTGTWWIFKSTGGTISTQWGSVGDVPVPGDYDGDGKTDLAIWRPSTATFYIYNSATSTIASKTWGVSSDVPVPGDYDGDGKTDIALWRPSTGAWLIVFSSNGQSPNWVWGISTDALVPGDFDGDGKTDLGVWRPTTGAWLIYQSGGGTLSPQWGTLGDLPVR